MFSRFSLLTLSVRRHDAAFSSFLVFFLRSSFFSINLYFLKGRLFCVAFVFCLFEQLGDEYFSWYGTGISLDACT